MHRPEPSPRGRSCKTNDSRIIGLSIKEEKLDSHYLVGLQEYGIPDELIKEVKEEVPEPLFLELDHSYTKNWHFKEEPEYSEDNDSSSRSFSINNSCLVSDNTDISTLSHKHFVEVNQFHHKEYKDVERFEDEDEIISVGCPDDEHGYWKLFGPNDKTNTVRKGKSNRSCVKDRNIVTCKGIDKQSSRLKLNKKNTSRLKVNHSWVKDINSIKLKGVGKSKRSSKLNLNKKNTVRKCKKDYSWVKDINGFKLTGIDKLSSRLNRNKKTLSKGKINYSWVKDIHSVKLKVQDNRSKKSNNERFRRLKIKMSLMDLANAVYGSECKENMIYSQRGILSKAIIIIKKYNELDQLLRRRMELCNKLNIFSIVGS